MLDAGYWMLDTGCKEQEQRANFNEYLIDSMLNGVANTNEFLVNFPYAENLASLSLQELADCEKEGAPLGKNFCRR